MNNLSTTYLSVNDLCKHFGAFQALKNISIEINEGEFACFLGPSGCGKTTLLRCIAGLETQSSGSISQKEIEISSLPPSARDFGIVFQSYALFPNLTVFSNISYGLINNKWGKDEIKSRVEHLLDLVGLKSHAGKYPRQKSKISKFGSVYQCIFIFYLKVYINFYKCFSCVINLSNSRSLDSMK